MNEALEPNQIWQAGTNHELNKMVTHNRPFFRQAEKFFIWQKIVFLNYMLSTWKCTMFYESIAWFSMADNAMDHFMLRLKIFFGHAKKFFLLKIIEYVQFFSMCKNIHFHTL